MSRVLCWSFMWVLEPLWTGGASGGCARQPGPASPARPSWGGSRVPRWTLILRTEVLLPASSETLIQAEAGQPWEAGVMPPEAEVTAGQGTGAAGPTGSLWARTWTRRLHWVLWSCHSGLEGGSLWALEGTPRGLGTAAEAGTDPQCQPRALRPEWPRAVHLPVGVPVGSGKPGQEGVAAMTRLRAE